MGPPGSACVRAHGYTYPIIEGDRARQVGDSPV